MPVQAGIDLGGVQKTLLLPLWGRAMESGKKHSLLVDPTAVHAVESMDYDFSAIANNISEVTRAAWIARSLHADRTIRAFFSKHPRATVVNLGCGLDTTFARVDNGSAIWYDLDLPDVIDLRRHFIADTARSKTIACSMFSNDWLPQVRGVDVMFFLSMGVLYYFDEQRVRGLLRKLADEFPDCEAFFDVCSPTGLKVANKKVIQASGMDQDAMLRWAIRHPQDLETWDSRIAVLEEYPMFRGFKSAVDCRTWIGTLLSDALRIQSIVHVHLAGDSQGRTN